jgi:hypothetical protein
MHPVDFGIFGKATSAIDNLAKNVEGKTMITFDVRDLKFMFVTNPKSGVTSTHHLLANILHEDFRRYDHVDANTVNENKHVAFIFRNPYERVVSMFFRFNRVLWTDPTGMRGSVTNNILKKYDKEEGFTFIDFLTYLKEMPNNERDIHYRCQDIPKKYDCLILTHRYLDDVLSCFKQIGYVKGVEVLSGKTAADVIANNVKKGESQAKEDVLILKTFEFQKFEESGYPPYDLFLNLDTQKLIENIFYEETRFFHSVQNTRMAE